MKRLHYLFLALCMVASAMVFSSCEYIEDGKKSMVLSGEWRGDFGMYYTYLDRYGNERTYDSYDTHISFVPAYDHAHYGTGVQVDYYEQGPYEYQYYRFHWSVDGSVIYLTYDYDHDLDTRISDYHMTNDYLSGIFDYSGTSFRLYKLVDYYDWTPYVNSYGKRDRYYASATRSDGDEATDSIAAPTEEGKVLVRGRRTTTLKQ